MTNKIRMTPKGFLAEDPRGLCVKMIYQGRELLGKVTAAHFDQVCGVTRLTVQYFCGDAWPIQPSPFSVEII